MEWCELGFDHECIKEKIGKLNRIIDEVYDNGL